MRVTPTRIISASAALATRSRRARTGAPPTESFGRHMVSSPLLLLFCAALVGASPGRRLQDEAPAPPLWRKLQAKMNIEFCSKNTASELEPCKAEVFQESLKGLSLEEKKMKIDAAISEIEAKKKKKIAMIIHEVPTSIKPLPTIPNPNPKPNPNPSPNPDPSPNPKPSPSSNPNQDSKSMYDEFCAKDGPKANSEICTNTELSSYLV